MAEIDLKQYGITGTTEIVHNPSYEMAQENIRMICLISVKKKHFPVIPCLRERTEM